jgi:acyl-CoA thioester hydrolase
MADPILVHVAEIQVRWGDHDALGHVNAPKYFTYFEQARADWMRVHGLTIQTDQGPVLAKTSCAFRRPIVYPGDVRVEIYSSVPERLSLTTTYRILNENGTLCAEGEGIVVWFDFEANRPIRFPRDMIKRLVSPFHRDEAP